MEILKKYVCSYDQAGNLVKTVPPAGVDDKHGDANFLDQVSKARKANQLKVPHHTLATNYRYNSLNSVVAQLSPDGGQTKFWYDKLARVAVSQNAEQQLHKNYSYTLYDDLGRIKEVGQLKQAVVLTQATAQNEKLLADWLAGQPAEQITRTFYDKTYFEGADLLCPGLLCQQNLRNRVSFTATYATGTPGVAAAGTHEAATYYSYAIGGGVDTLLQDYNSGIMKSTGNRFKKIVYDYDLISGKVNKVSYQPGQSDEFYHKYFYDAENRLTDVYSSKDALFYERDSRYAYYKHGSLARQIIGQNQVQGMDYAYTLQGWLKGVNSTAVGDGKFDMGADGINGSQVAMDAFGFALHYYSTAGTKDYIPVKGNLQPFANAAAAGFGFVSLYNGNIAATSMNIPKLGEPLLSTYKFDQLQRLTKVNSYKGLNPATNKWNVLSIDDYREELSYDPNGNIQTYKRNGSGNNLNLNNYSYTYQNGTNKLISLKNSVDNKVANYGYDATGNVIKDEKQNVLNNTWNVYGKLQSVEKKDGKIITYSYDASGNRISKTAGDTTEIYVRDASGNVMLTYQQNPTINSGHLSTKAFYKYGSNLLGVKKKAIDLEAKMPDTEVQNFVTGEDEYYLYGANGNIIGSVSDKKLQHDDDNDGIIDRYSADVRTATMFSAYGAMSKSYNGDSIPRAFNGQQRSMEISPTAQTAEFWEYNGDVGRRWNMDVKPNLSVSPYAAFENNPIWYTDVLGDTIKPQGTFADASSPNRQGLNLLFKGNTFKTAMQDFDIGGGLTGNASSGKYASRINVNFISSDEEVTHTDNLKFTDKNGKTGFTKSWTDQNGVTHTYERAYDLSNIKDYADQFDETSIVTIDIYRQNSYGIGTVLTAEGAAFDMKHEVGVHAIVNHFPIAKAFIDGGVTGALAASKNAGRLRGENYSHGYAATGNNLPYLQMTRELKPLFTLRQLANYKGIALGHFNREGYIPAYRGTPLTKKDKVPDDY